MAATVTPNANHNLSYRMSALQHYGFKIEVGTWTPTTLGAYTTVGEVITFNCKTKPTIVFFQPLINLTALTTIAYGVDFRYDHSNGSVRAFLGSTAVGIGGFEATTTYAAATTAAIPYIAFTW